MVESRNRLRLIVTLILACGSGSGAASPDRGPASGPAKPPRADRSGDPLPEGAVARLGIPYLPNPGAEILAFLPDGKTLAIAVDDILLLWDVGSGRERRRFRMPLRQGDSRTRILHLAVSPDGKFLAAGCEDGVARVWEADTGKELRLIQEQNAPVLNLAFSPDGKRLAALSPPHFPGVLKK